jgi:sirohydrochlorin cobaltochelatase
LALKPDQVRLIPLLTLIGAHALEDMAGDDPGSWKGRLAKLGLTPQPEFRGLLDRPRVIELWLQRLRQAWELLHTQAQILGLT